jgi:hypothetical protein
MTNKEHKLIIGMLATQLALTTKLIETLRDNSSLSPADFQKIWKDAISTGPEKKHFFEQVSQLYKGMASACGVSVEIDDAPSAAR